jgi:NAD(P)-dependent dehydrogenase (short-subunit alcohol dehydrogenase family)
VPALSGAGERDQRPAAVRVGAERGIGKSACLLAAQEAARDAAVRVVSTATWAREALDELEATGRRNEEPSSKSPAFTRA